MISIFQNMRKFPRLKLLAQSPSSPKSRCCCCCLPLKNVFWNSQLELCGCFLRNFIFVVLFFLCVPNLIHPKAKKNRSLASIDESQSWLRWKNKLFFYKTSQFYFMCRDSVFLFRLILCSSTTNRADSLQFRKVFFLMISAVCTLEKSRLSFQKKTWIYLIFIFSRWSDHLCVLLCDFGDLRLSMDFTFIFFFLFFSRRDSRWQIMSLTKTSEKRSWLITRWHCAKHFMRAVRDGSEVWLVGREEKKWMGSFHFFLKARKRNLHRFMDHAFLHALKIEILTTKKFKPVFESIEKKNTKIAYCNSTTVERSRVNFSSFVVIFLCFVNRPTRRQEEEIVRKIENY